MIRFVFGLTLLGAARDIPANLPDRDAYVVTIYDAKTGRPVREFRSPSEINSVAFAPSSKLVLIGARYAVVIGELATGRTEVWPPQGEKRENDDSVSSITWNWEHERPAQFATASGRFAPWKCWNASARPRRGCLLSRWQTAPMLS